MSVRNRIDTVLRHYWVILLAPFLLLLPILGRGQVLFWGTPSLQFIPWWVAAVNGLKQGVLPLWNPLNGMGAPLLANYQAAFFYPPNWFLIPLGWVSGAPGIALGYTLLTGVHLAWAGLGMAVLIRKLGFTWFAQVIGGVTFSLSGYIIARLGFFSMVWVAAWFPWVIYSVDRFVNLSAAPANIIDPKNQKDNYTFLFSLVFCLAMQLLAGHAQLTWYSMIFAGVWVIVGLLRRLSRKQFFFSVGFFALAVVAAVGIAAVQLIPTYEYLRLSQRSDAFAYQEAMVYSFWPWRLITLFSPDFFGSPAQGNYWGYASYWEDHLYLGLIPLILALTSISPLLKSLSPSQRSSRWLPVWVCWGMILLGFVLGFGKNLPVFPFLYHHIPTFDMFQAPTRYLVWAAFGFPILAAAGLDCWRCPTGRGLYWFRLGTAGAFAITLGAGLSFWLIKDIRLTFIRSTALTGLWGLGFGLLTLAIPWAVTPFRKKFWQASVIFLCVCDLLISGWALNPGVGLQFFSERQMQPVHSLMDGTRVYLSPDNEYELKFRRFYRFNSFLPNESWETINQTLLPNLNLLAGIPSVNNFDPLVAERYQKWMTEVNRIKPDARSGWLAFLNTGWVEQIDLQTGPGVRFDPLPAAGRWQWYGCGRVVRNQAEAWEYLQKEMQSAPSADRRVLLELTEITSQPACLTGSTPKIEILSEKDNQISLRVETSAPGWLELKDSWYPGWQAEISGQPAQVLIADVLFRAVQVPAGNHIVTFYYRPIGFYFGSLFSILILLLILFLLIRKGR